MLVYCFIIVQLVGRSLWHRVRPHNSDSERVYNIDPPRALCGQCNAFEHIHLVTDGR
jgi:hypothetical protein